MTPAEKHNEELRIELNLQTSRMAWQELQRHFASGIVIGVSADLDLIDVAVRIANDDKAAITQWMGEQRIGQASDAQAAEWLAGDVTMWTVVVKPWILVQPEKRR